MKKKFLSSVACLLVISLLFPYFTMVANAVCIELNDIRVDECITENYAVALFREEDLEGEKPIYYSITLESSDKIEFASSEIGGIVNSVWMTLDDMGTIVLEGDFLSLIHDNVFLQKVKDYGTTQISQGNAEVFCVDVVSFTDEVSYPVPLDLNYGALRDKLEAIHGEAHTMEEWQAAENKYGLKFEYVENLDLPIRTSRQFTVSDGMSLGSLATSIAGVFPLAYATILSKLSILLGVAAFASTLLQSTKIMTYTCEATYERMVLINGKGPYHEAWRQVYYIGLVEMGNDSAPELVKSEQEDFYDPPSRIFESYVIQRERAYENYKNQI